LAETRPELDQALFGYSDGHRLIASSTRLPPKDLYLLSATSDLASGTRLTGDESYLTGLPLPDSRKYALMRTWAAPEMPRPGCVWTHALILDQRALSSLPAFSVLLSLLKRPNAPDTSSYEGPIDLDLKTAERPADASLAAMIVEVHYGTTDRTTLPANIEPAKLEAAILAIWSQQWPRLRAAFSFQTAIATERRRSETATFDVQVGSADEFVASKREEWSLVAGRDAAANEVTPLRRFLWRYSRDLANSRAHYRDLVELHIGTADVEETPKEVASRLFDAFPDPAEGAILKFDLIGTGGHTPGLAPAVSVIDLIEILSERPAMEAPSPDQLRERLADLLPSDVPNVAKMLDSRRSALSKWEPVIEEAIVAKASRASLVPDFPNSLVPRLLQERPDLIDAKVLSRLPDGALEELLSADRDTEVLALIASELVRRDLGPTEDKLIESWPLQIFRSAIDACAKGALDRSWFASMTRHQGAVLDSPWLDAIDSTQILAKALQLLGYPRNLHKSVDEIYLKIKAITDDAAGSDRMDLQACFLRFAFDCGAPGSWRVFVAILPELRPKIIQESLSPFAHEMLTADLPRFYSAVYWDLDKRILLGLSKLYKKHPDEQALRDLRLSQRDLEIVLVGEDDENRRSLWNPLSWLP
jgi:GTPase-associated protein 1, N-terminal domain type 1